MIGHRVVNERCRRGVGKTAMSSTRDDRADVWEQGVRQ